MQRETRLFLGGQHVDATRLWLNPVLVAKLCVAHERSFIRLGASRSFKLRYESKGTLIK